MLKAIETNAKNGKNSFRLHPEQQLQMIERTANMKITRTSKTFYYVKRTYSLFEHQASSAHLHEIFVNYTGLSEN